YVPAAFELVPFKIASQAAPSATSVPAPLRVIEVGQYASSFWWWAMTGPVGGVIGGLIGTLLSIGRWRQSGRTHTFQVGKLLLTNALEEARTQLTPFMRRQFRATRRRFEDALVAAVAERNRQLQDALELAARTQESPEARRGPLG